MDGAVLPSAGEVSTRRASFSGMAEANAVCSAIVTGVGRRRGIGAAVCRRLLYDGWFITATGWPQYDAQAPWMVPALDDLQALIDDLQPSGRFGWLPLDLERVDAAKALFDAVPDDSPPLTALVAAHARSLHGGILDATPEDFDLHLAVNARSTLLLIREFARRWSNERSEGRIVTFVSRPPLAGEIAYAASKGAIEWLTLSAAAELAPRGIALNAVDPGPTDTGWLTSDVAATIRASSPPGRIGKPEEVAELVSLLCSGRGGWSSGQVIRHDGGWRTVRP
jgi:3-oxoacyl-[acyl-carrier protein] reductase